MRKILLTLGFVGLISVDVSAFVLNPDSLNLIKSGQPASFSVFGQAPDYKLPDVSAETMKSAIEGATGKKVKVEGPWTGNESSNTLAFRATPID